MCLQQHPQSQYVVNTPLAAVTAGRVCVDRSLSALQFSPFFFVKLLRLSGCMRIMSGQPFSKSSHISSIRPRPRLCLSSHSKVLTLLFLKHFLSSLCLYVCAYCLAGKQIFSKVTGCIRFSSRTIPLL